MKPSELLKKGWCQGAHTKDINGIKVATSSQRVAYVTFLGAAIRGLGLKQRVEFIKKSLSHIDGGHLCSWNDAPGRTQAEVVALAERVEKEMGI